MKKIFVGFVSSTHGIKGELKILSQLDENLKPIFFKVHSHLFIDHCPYEIKTYRRHQNFDMVTFDSFNNINEVLPFVKKKVYKDIEEIELNENEVLDEELLTFTVLTEDGKQGLIKKIEKTGKNYKILRLDFNGKEVLLPYHKDFIVRINKKEKKITVRLL